VNGTPAAPRPPDCRQRDRPVGLAKAAPRRHRRHSTHGPPAHGGATLPAARFNEGAVVPAPAVSVSISAPADHSALLDNWRGWAIFFVMAGHFAHVPAVDAGRVGVELFFVLSGRLMADLLFRKRTPIPTFFYRRFTRVLPLSLMFVFTAWIAFPPGPLFLPDKAALASVGMVVNYTQLLGVSAPVTDHYWSLCVEEHSYLALAILALLLRRGGRAQGTWPAAICLGLAALMMLNGVRLWFATHDYYMTYWRSDVRAASIFLSVGLRVLALNGRLAFMRQAWVPLVAFALGLACNYHRLPEPVKYCLGTLGIAVAVNTLEQASAWARRFLSSRAIGWVGVISYSLYIWQQPFYYSIEHHGAAAMAAFAFAVAVVSFYLVENPIRVNLNQRLRRASASRLAPAAGQP
jgi:peptidoglycan/LPS O-acetylase OafA/YrhL